MPRPTEMMRRLARLGAEERTMQIRAEVAEILREFPELRSGLSERSDASSRGQRRRKRTMTVAQRKAVGARMRKYWAARRAAKK